MKRSKSTALRTLLLVLCGCIPNLAAALQPGDRLTGFTIADQHGKPGQIDESTKLLMFSRDMKANKLAKSAFMSKPADYLPTAHAAYVIDVSGMPKFVTNTFAIPKMQKYGYRIYLDRDATLTTGLPTQKATVTLIHLDRLQVTAIEYASTPDALVHGVDAAAR